LDNAWVVFAQLEDWARKRERNQNQRANPHEQDRPIPDGPSSYRLNWQPAEEHQGRKLNGATSVAPDQVDDHRHQDGQEAGQEERR
jgi:hypothetical protein